jgi:hypothetical protein
MLEISSQTPDSEQIAIKSKFNPLARVTEEGYTIMMIELVLL